MDRVPSENTLWDPSCAEVTPDNISGKERRTPSRPRGNGHRPRLAHAAPEIFRPGLGPEVRSESGPGTPVFGSSKRNNDLSGAPNGLAVLAKEVEQLRVETGEK